MSYWSLLTTNKLLIVATFFGCLIAACAIVAFCIAYNTSRKERLRIRNNIAESIKWAFSAEGSSKEKQRWRNILSSGVNNIVAGTPTNTTIPISIIAALCIFGTAFIVTGNIVLTFAIEVAVILAICAYISAKRTARARQIEDQFCRACRQIASSLRSGMTLEASIKLCAAHAKDPLASELEKAILEFSINSNISQAIKNIAVRTKNKDIELFSTVIDLHERKGGQLAGSLETLSSTISTRLSMRRRVRSESSSAKVACVAVVLISIGIFAIGWFMIPSFVEFYTTQPAGWAIAAACVGMFIAGAAILYKMADVDVN